MPPGPATRHVLLIPSLTHLKITAVTKKKLLFLGNNKKIIQFYVSIFVPFLYVGGCKSLIIVIWPQRNSVERLHSVTTVSDSDEKMMMVNRKSKFSVWRFSFFVYDMCLDVMMAKIIASRSRSTLKLVPGFYLLLVT